MKWYKVLAAVAILSILLAFYVPTVHAQGGRCRRVAIQYYSEGRLITEWVWRCTGYIRPRQPRWRR